MIKSVNVYFQGTVDIEVPDGISPEFASRLAENFVLSRIVVTSDNPDAPDDAACDELVNDFPMIDVDRLWDLCEIKSVGGSWAGISPKGS